MASKHLLAPPFGARLTPRALMGALALSACTGAIDEGAPPSATPVPPPADGATLPPAATPPTSGGGVAPGPPSLPQTGRCGVAGVGFTRVRRLTRDEYSNTVRDLLGDPSLTIANALPSDEIHRGFRNNVLGQGVSALLASGYFDAAEKLAASAMKNLPRVLPCDPKADEDACGRKFIESFGMRAFRRPLRPDETTRLQTFFNARKSAGFETAVRLTMQLMLASPNFLYRIEATVADGPPRPLGPYELASRLSYLFWRTMPDQTLFAAAAEGRLSTPDQISAQAARMLADPRARQTILDFHHQWLGLDELDDVVRDPKLHPGWNETLIPTLRSQVHRFAEEVAFGKDRRLPAFWNADFTFANKALASFLGLTGPTGSALELVAVAPGTQAGLLTMPGILAMTSHQDQPSPILRGKWVRERLLCQELPSPPPGVLADVPPVDPKVTGRARFARHASEPSCAGCHRLMDSIGFGFERYDPTGRLRANDHGLPIDARGEVLDGGDASGAFEGTLELGRKLAESQTVRACLATQWFRYAFGRVESPEDTCTIADLGNAGSGDLRTLMTTLVRSPAFLQRSPDASKE